LVLGLLGLTIILAPDKLHDLIFSWLNYLNLLYEQMGTTFGNFMDRLTLTDWTGFLLLITFLAIIGWRVRVRLRDSSRLSANACPDCGSELHRIHRNSFDYLLGSLSGAPLRRYKCSNASCGWQGLRQRRTHHHHSENE
jgi:hypothetical protein